MSIAPGGVSAVKVFINPHGQTREHVEQIVNSVLGRGGCMRCGLVAYLAVEFAGDPGPDLGKTGVISVNTAG